MQIGIRIAGVIGTDIYGLDRDGNGLGCE